MNDIDILNRMIKDAAKIKASEVYGKKAVTLIEEQTRDSKVEISGIPSNAIIIKIDSFPPPEHIFSCSKGECKRADFAIIAESKGKKRILYIEMKKTRHSEKEIISQFKGAECVLAYCIQVAETFYNTDKFLSGYKPCFVAFYHTSIRKRNTRVSRKAPKHNRPERMMKIQWPNKMQYSHLVGV